MTEFKEISAKLPDYLQEPARELYIIGKSIPQDQALRSYYYQELAAVEREHKEQVLERGFYERTNDILSNTPSHLDRAHLRRTIDSFTDALDMTFFTLALISIKERDNLARVVDLYTTVMSCLACGNEKRIAMKNCMTAEYRKKALKEVPA